MKGSPITPQARVRGWLLLGVVVVQVTAALPLPTRFRAEWLELPEAVEELERWSGTLGVERVAFSRAVARAGETTSFAKRKLLLPFRPVFRWTGTGQGWALFASPDVLPERVDVVAIQAGQELLLHRAHELEARPALRNRRVRGVFKAAGGAERGPWAHLAAELAERSLQDHPQAEAIELRVFVERLVRPSEQVPRRPERLVHTLRFERP